MFMFNQGDWYYLFYLYIMVGNCCHLKLNQYRSKRLNIVLPLSFRKHSTVNVAIEGFGEFTKWPSVANLSPCIKHHLT